MFRIPRSRKIALRTSVEGRSLPELKRSIDEAPPLPGDIKSSPRGALRNELQCMRTDQRKVRELLEEYALLIPLVGDIPPEDKARMRDLERELLKHGCLLDF